MPDRAASFVRGLAIAPLGLPVLAGILGLVKLLTGAGNPPGELYYLAKLTWREYLVAAVIALPGWLAYRGGRFKKAGWFALGGSLVGSVASAVISSGVLGLAGEWRMHLAAAIPGAASGLLFWLVARPDRLAARESAGHPRPLTRLTIGALSIAVLVVVAALTYEARWEARSLTWFQAREVLKPGTQLAAVDAYFSEPGLSETWAAWDSRKYPWSNLPKACGGGPDEPESVVSYVFDEGTRAIVVFDGNQRMLCVFQEAWHF